MKSEHEIRMNKYYESYLKDLDEYKQRLGMEAGAIGQPYDPRTVGSSIFQTIDAKKRWDIGAIPGSATPVERATEAATIDTHAKRIEDEIREEVGKCLKREVSEMGKIEDVGMVGTLKGGEIAIKIPGYKFGLEYSGGKAYVNEKGTIGYVALDLTDVNASEDGEATLMTTFVGDALVEQLNDPETKAMVRKMIKGKKVSIFISKTKDGREIMTMPSLNEGRDYENFEQIVGLYKLEDRVPNVSEVYDFHVETAREKELSADGEAMKALTINLPQKAQKFYDEAVKKMAEESLF